MSSDKKKKKRSASEAKKKDKVETPQIMCDGCNTRITFDVRIRCAECPEGLDLCVPCFAKGVEPPGEPPDLHNHKKTHKYSVVDQMAYPILEENWQASEELLLLEGIDLYGYGNWADISDHIGSKGKLQCMAHYESIFLTQNGLPSFDGVYPPQSSWARWKAQYGESDWLYDTSNKDEDRPAKRKKTDATSSNKKPKAKKDTKKKTPAELAGYYVNRGDFDTEYYNAAENVVKDMEWNDEDELVIRELKFATLEAYNMALDERMRRKNFIFERGLVEGKTDNERRFGKECRDIIDRMRVFARHHSVEEHGKLLDGLVEEQRIRRRIRELQNYRRAGLTTFVEAEYYEEDTKRRESALSSSAMKRTSDSYIYGMEARAATRSRSSRYLNRSRTTATAATATPALTPVVASGSPHMGLPLVAIDASTTATGAIGGMPGTPGAGVGVASPSAAPPPPTPRVPVVPLSVANMPGAELLSAREQRLCGAVQITPQHYAIIKQALMKEALRQGYLKKSTARLLLKIDAAQAARIYDFMVESGWIRSEPVELLPAALGARR